jgi:hypothetical protein
MTNYSFAQLLPVLFDHACNHAIDEWYQFMVQCLHAQNLLRVFQYKIWDHYCWSPHAIDHCIPSVCYDKWEKFVQKYFTKSINSQNSTKRQKLTISQKSQNDSSLQNSTNVIYAPNYKNMQYS